MKLTLLIVAAGAVVAATAYRHARSEPLVHVRNHFSFRVRAAAATVFPLFGADMERRWAAGWAPTFVYPTPARDTAGMVFTIAHGATHSVWVNTAFDSGTGRVQYVSVIPGAVTTLIDIQVTPLDSAETSVTVNGITLDYPSYPSTAPLLHCEPWNDPTANVVTLSGVPAHVG